MGNKSSGELWTGVYSLQEKEFLGFNDLVAEKVQAGELDLGDAKQMSGFAQEFNQSIVSDRAKLQDALWETYSKAKATFGRDESRNLVKDALREGKVHLPRILENFSEVYAMRKHSLKATQIRMDPEAKPLLDASLARIRKDVGDRVRQDLHELLGDANALADKLLYKLINGPASTVTAAASAAAAVSTAAPAESKEKAAKPKADAGYDGSDDEEEELGVHVAPEPDYKLDGKASVGKEQFLKHFTRAFEEALNLLNLVESARAQFTNFLEMEIRQIPHRVIEKLERQEEAAAAGAAAGAEGDEKAGGASTDDDAEDSN